MNRQEIYSKTAQRIVAQLEVGEIPWIKPWNSPSNAAYNAATGKVYSYLNSLLLGAAGGYCTFKQSLEIGKGINKGAKAFTIFQPREIMKKKQTAQQDPDEEETGEEQPEENTKRFIYFPVYVFPLSCVRELDETKIKYPENYQQQQPDKSADEMALEALFQASIVKDFYLMKNGIKYSEGNEEAKYNAQEDKIFLPDSSQFCSAEEFYSTFFHEATHSTGIKSRLNRGLDNGRQTTTSRANEEITAELGSAFICANLGLDFANIIKNQAAYIQGWIKQLNDDPGIIFRNASKAAKAANFILSV